MTGISRRPSILGAASGVAWWPLYQYRAGADHADCPRYRVHLRRHPAFLSRRLLSFLLRFSWSQNLQHHPAVRALVVSLEHRKLEPIVRIVTENQRPIWLKLRGQLLR